MKKALAKAVSLFLYSALMVFEWCLDVLSKYTEKAHRNSPTRILEDLCNLESRNTATKPSRK